MKKLVYSFALIFTSVAIFIQPCSAGLFSKSPTPEYFGMYILENDKLIEMKGNKLSWTGNFMSAVVGLKEPSKIHIKDNKAHFILYSKEIPYSSVRLSKLEYKTSGQVDGIMSKQSVNVNMWVEKENIDLKVAPIEDKNNMYRLVPHNKLDDGFYAIHYGNLSGRSTIEAVGENKVVYGFVVGNPQGKVKEYFEMHNPTLIITTQVLRGSPGFSKETMKYNSKLKPLEQTLYYDNTILYKVINSYSLVNGNLSQESHFNAEGVEVIKKVYSYSNDGRSGELISYSNGKVDTKDIRLFDDSGRLLQSKRYREGASIPIKTTEVKYNNKGQKVEDISYNRNKSSSKVMISYDENGRKTQQNHYDISGKLFAQEKYEYDTNGRLIRKQYDYINQKTSSSHQSLVYNKNDIEIEDVQNDNNDEVKTILRMVWSNNIPEQILHKVVLDMFVRDVPNH